MRSGIDLARTLVAKADEDFVVADDLQVVRRLRAAIHALLPPEAVP
ncbi:MAG TPA: hypothetical protein VLE22_23790 [Bryobacteraceae bacterium]|nr:hypothetical protein [Bryobacteraceae bacterium]